MSATVPSIANVSMGSSIYNATSPNSDAEMIERTSQQHEEIMIRHLDLSIRHWMSLPPHEQRSLWQLEITRAFAREAEKRKRVEEQLERTQQEANQLRAQVEKFSSCQWPREFAIFPPNLLPLSPEVARELDEKQSKMNSAESSRWEYDNLVAKWKRVVMHDKSMGRSGVGAYMDPILERQHAASATKDLLRKIPNSNSRLNANPGRTGAHSPSHHSNPVSPESINQDRQSVNPPTPYEPRDVNDANDTFRAGKRPRTESYQPRISYHGDEMSSQTPPNSSHPTAIPTAPNSSNHSTQATSYPYGSHSPLPPPTSIGREAPHYSNYSHRPLNTGPESHLNTHHRPYLDHRSPAEREVSNAMLKMHHEATPQHSPLPPPPPPPPSSQNQHQHQHQQNHSYTDTGNRGLPMGITSYSRHHGGVP